ncbi:hypothetical protein D9757_000050 [Collybiopsis confluens]|uniref:Uncharacterized protein n=1 Tax=Collybiopsis confluens TaxID=2823264 RepID=A0A8H5I2S4_9AGAR|nr:hypothetical protein D9757_000050 [Collybiopsis confluens]
MFEEGRAAEDLVSGKGFNNLSIEYLLPPRAFSLWYTILQIKTNEGREGNENDIGLWIETSSFDKRRQLLFNLIKPSLVPKNGWVIHLVDGDDDLRYPSRFNQHDVLPGLTTTFKSGFKLALSCGYNQNRDISLSGPRNHRWDKGLVPRGIKDGVTTSVRFEVCTSDLDCFPFNSLLGS